PSAIVATQAPIANVRLLIAVSPLSSRWISPATVRSPDEFAMNAFRRRSGTPRHDRKMERRALLLLSLVIPAVATACGGSRPASTGNPPPSPAPTATSTVTPAPTKTTTSRSAAAPPLQGEAVSAAAGDIPDNQVFVIFRNGS